jgi:TonB family protein
MTKLIVIIFFALTSPAFAQDSTVFFYDKSGQTTVDLDEAFSYRIIVQQDSLLYIRHYYASNDQLLIEGTFSKVGHTLEHHGPLKSFHKNGKLESEGTYSKDKKVGLWKEYYPNGQQADETFHQDDKIVYHQHWDEAGNPMLINGTGKFIAGTQHAEVIDSILFSLFTIDAVSGDSIYLIVEKKAEYKGGLDAFFAETQKDLRYPKLAREYLVEGKVFVEFVIDKSGKLHNAKVIQGIGGGCDEAALNAVKKRTNWSPAEVRGKAVSQKMALPIAFNIR